jgi:hypothetical protein
LNAHQPDVTVFAQRETHEVRGARAAKEGDSVTVTGDASAA